MENPATSQAIVLHDTSAFEGMRRAGRLAAGVLDMLCEKIVPGVSTETLDRLAFDHILEHGGVPACLGYKGYTHSLCTSLNRVICHGIPNPKPLKKGDILNIDVTVILDGWHGDTSRMYAVGKPKILAQRLMDVTYECLQLAINEVGPGSKFGDISKVIDARAHDAGFSVVTDFCGHGLGQQFHMPPDVMHGEEQGYANPFADVEMKPGMFFTIEPMINAGRKDGRLKADGWTAVTKDRSLSAQFEHSMGVTQTGVEIFTASPKGFDRPYLMA